MITVFVKPVNGAIIRDPLTLEVIPEAGRNIVLTTYWRRKIMQGYLEITEETCEETLNVKEANYVDLI
jgi:hypothetical protein